MLTPEEIALGRRCIDLALAEGASAVRVTLNKSLTDTVGMLSGEVDKVTHSLDRSITLCIFADGRYGTFSLNRLEETAMQAFIRKAVATVRMLAPDPYRHMPDKARKVTDALTGREAGRFDPAYEGIDTGKRLELARQSSLWPRKVSLEKGFSFLSEEGEYSDSIYDTLILDSDGLYARHTLNSYSVYYEATVADPDGNRFSGFWWDSSPFLSGILPAIGSCAREALDRAVAQIGPGAHPGGRISLAVQAGCASKLLDPLLTALSGFSIQQKNSFLLDCLGKKVFSERFTVRDMPRKVGSPAGKWFDSEGIATFDAPIIEGGVVKQYFINTYIAAKTGLAPTVEDITHPVVESTGDCRSEEDILRLLGEGILVTGFNGGNSNSATGDFSYGIEGFAFSGGKITHPVREMLMTGNFITLWQHLAAVADDARPCATYAIPTLAFTDVDVR